MSPLDGWPVADLVSILSFSLYATLRYGTMAPVIVDKTSQFNDLIGFLNRAADKDSSLTGHLTVIIFDPGFIVHVCPDK